VRHHDRVRIGAPDRDLGVLGAVELEASAGRLACCDLEEDQGLSEKYSRTYEAFCDASSRRDDYNRCLVMPVPARVIIAFARTDADQSAAGSLATGFQREGLPVERIDEPDRVLAALRDDDLLVVSAHLGAEKKGEEGVALVRAVRAK